MKTRSERKEIGARLQQMSAELDAAIQQAITDPLVFADSPLLLSIDSHCAQLMQYQLMQYQGDQHQPEDASEETRLLADQIWEIRARAGRWQRLLESASRFYSTCFSSQQSFSWQQADGLAYGMHGEWGGMASASHLSVDC